MTYETIKVALRRAAALIESGDIEAADSCVQSVVGRGLTRADLDANLTPEQIGKLRAYARGRG